MTPERKALGALLAAAAAGRLLYCFAFGPYDPWGAVADIDVYQSFARSLAATGTFALDGVLSASREPGYPVFLAALYSLFGASFPVVWAAHACLEAGTVLLVFLSGKRVFGRNAAWGAAVMAAVYPQMVYYAGEPRRESLLVFLTVLSAWLLLRACERPEYKRFAAAGLSWAAAALTNSVFVPIGAAAAAAAWWTGRLRGKNITAGCAVLLCVYGAVYALWPIRNYLVFNRFIPGITAGGAHIYVSLVVPNDVAGTPEEEKYVLADPVLMHAKDLPEDQKDRYFYREAAKWVARHPFRYIGVMGASFLKLWRLYPYERDYGANYRLIKWVSLLSDGWIIPLFFIGVFLAGRRFPEAWIPLAVVLAATFTYMVFWAVVRYRLPLMPFVFLYAAHALERGFARWKPDVLPFPEGA